MTYVIPTPIDIEVLAVRAGLTMGEACKRAGIAHTTFSRWKHGAMQPTVKTVEKLLMALQPTGVANDDK